MMRTRRLIGIIIFFLSAIVCVHSFLWAAEEKMLSTQVREALEAQFPDTLAALRREYGLHPFVPVDTGKVGGAGQSVILIHGLDDPGLIWQDLAPALAGQGFRVFIMSYPNDQPIRDSAAFFFKQLQELAGRAGRERTAPVAIVGHSMGGLVTREMLTSPAIGYARAEEARLVPPLSHFIMIGTPNHGSVFSRLRLLTEIRDQAIIGAEKGYHWLRPMVDGLGEAATDIYPDSEFLTELNCRPLPRIGRMLVIAGVMSPLEQGEIVAYLQGLRGLVPKPVQPPPGFELLVGKMIDQLGDGLVSVESARLPGVPLIQVQGTHVTMIRNLGGSNSRIPPAIPVILHELSAGHENDKR